MLQALQIGFAGSKFGQPVFQHGAETALSQGWHPIAKTERLQCTGDTVLTTPQIIDLPVLIFGKDLEPFKTGAGTTVHDGTKIPATMGKLQPYFLQQLLIAHKMVLDVDVSDIGKPGGQHQ